MRICLFVCVCVMLFFFFFDFRNLPHMRAYHAVIFFGPEQLRFSSLYCAWFQIQFVVMEIQPFTKGTWSVGRPIITQEGCWFKAKAVATSLEYVHTAKAVWDHVEDEDKKTLKELLQGVNKTLNEQPHEVYVNESGLYSLVLRSKKRRARLFKRWLVMEVLPSIRSFGWQLPHQITAVNERLEKQEQALKHQDQMVFEQRQLLVKQERLVSAHSQELVSQGRLLSRIHADMKERLTDQDERLSAQGRLLSRILEVLDDGQATDVDSEVDEAPDDKPRRVIQTACASKRSVSDSGSLPDTCVRC